MKFYAFRSDLEVIERGDKSGSYRYFVRVPASGMLFEFGEEDFFLCKQLDGQSSLTDVQAKFETHFKMKLDISQVEALVRQLQEEGLLEGYAAKGPSPLKLFQFQYPDTWKRWKLFDPKRMTNWLAEQLWWCYTRAFGITSAILFILAVGVVFRNFSEFIRDVSLLFGPLSIFQVFATMYIFLNIPQELMRAVTTARFGGRPEEFGIWLAFDVLPRFYCWSKVWEVRGRTRRSWVLFTPTYYSLVFGSIGILMWKMTVPSLFLHKFGLILSVLCFLDSMVRLFPLWPNEAHYILSNWLDIPHFRKRAVDAAKAWFFHKGMPEPLTPKERRLFIGYGSLTATATFVALVVIAYFLGRELIRYLAGLGALIFLTVGIAHYRKGIAGLLMENRLFQRLSEIRIGGRLRRPVRLVFWMVALGVIFLFPWFYEPGGPFKLLPVEHVELHTEMSGEIKKVLVRENDRVKRGDVQALIDTREHQKNLDVSKAELEKVKAELVLLEKGEVLKI